ncbi:mechanosensitive ion channel family protein [Tumebacillus permanentifrigoris]|uniref:Small conductance mechanosensitive channel n=1 Tax=Tumebacillus permanentifrigoris TaxID=378543 RepID=A0A316DGE2_9BACL|nr:mechanosensitive ion channel family protein [Tumebacillus permanentifrigoris]PWK16592.1 small conductance mechanosensitive channel [Tumebacillus permanentifrigoris]
MGTFVTTYDQFAAKFFNPEFWIGAGWILLKIAMILIVAKLAMKLADSTIGRIFGSRAMRMDERRSKTMTTLLLNVTHYVVYFMVMLTVLSNLGLDVTTLIAGAGVIGLAIGFGAQSLVKDVITGFFIIFEDQFGVGDNVMINNNINIRGNVEEVGLRVTKIRAYQGEVHILPNSQIQQVTNYSKTNSLAVLDVSVAYEEDLERVYHVLREVGEQLKADNEAVTGEPQVLGVQNFGPSEVIVRMTVECKPMENHAVGRELRERIKLAFERENIEIPYPKQVNLFHGEPEKQKQQQTGKA